MIELDSEIFEEEVVECNTPVFVVFTAPWCGACTGSEKLLDAMQRELAGVKFCSVDIDKQRELGDKYSIRGVPTSLVFEKGILKARKTGALTKADVYSMAGKKLVASE